MRSIMAFQNQACMWTAHVGAVFRTGLVFEWTCVLLMFILDVIGAGRLPNGYVH